MKASIILFAILSFCKLFSLDPAEDVSEFIKVMKILGAGAIRQYDIGPNGSAYRLVTLNKENKIKLTEPYRPFLNLKIDSQTYCNIARSLEEVTSYENVTSLYLSLTDLLEQDAPENKLIPSHDRRFHLRWETILRTWFEIHEKELPTKQEELED